MELELKVKNSPVAIIRSYWDRVYNERDYEHLRELCADPIIRHDPMSVTALSHEEQVARVRDSCERMKPYFTHEVLLADDTYVCSVWNMFTRTGEPMRISGIEVFKVEDGRFTDCWNSSYSLSYWGRDPGDEDPLQPPPPRRPWAQQEVEPATTATPRELIDRYFQLWNDGRSEEAREICADPMARYEPGAVHYLDADSQIARIAAQQAAASPYFSHEVVLADDTYVCSVWNMHTRKGERVERSGIEVFKAENGRLVQCWNAPHTEGLWGRRGDAAVPADLPPPHMLSSVEEIDHTWMQKVLLHAGVDVPRIAMVTTKPIGHGTASNTVRATIGYNQAVENVPLTVICKFHSEVPQAREMAARFQPFTTEVATYEFFGDEPPLLTPRVYYAEVSPDNLRANIVLEDLGAFCETGDQLAGCGQAEAAAVVKQLGLMHRRYWNQPGLADLPWTAYKRRPPEFAADLYNSGLAIFRARYRDLMSPDEMAIIEGFAPLVDAWIYQIPPARTLLHSDPRVDNIMFDRRDKDRVAAYLIDWQITETGDAMYDVAYFLSGSLSVDDRRACERALIADHTACIAEVDPAHTLDRALDSYRRQIGSGLYTTMLAINGMPDTPHNRALLTTLAHRNCAAVADWDGLGVLSAN